MGLRRSKLVSSRAADRTSTQHLNNGVEDAKVNAKCYETVARAHESFIQSVVVAAIKTLMLVRRWCRQTCRLFRHRFLISSTTDTGRLSLSLPLFLTLSLSLSLYLSIYLSIYLSPHDVYRFNCIREPVLSLQYSSLYYQSEMKLIIFSIYLVESPAINLNKLPL